MSPDEPRLRASHCKGTLRALHAVAPEAAARVLDALPAEVRDGLAAATGLDYVPAAWDVALVAAIEGAMEPPRARRIYRVTMVDNLGGPLLGSLVAGALKLFGASPAGLYRWAGRGHAHVCQGCGSLRLLEVGERSAVLQIASMPPPLVVAPYLQAMGATLEAVLDVCGVEGDVVTTPTHDGARFEARWRPRPQRP